ncbi:MAG: hypothetical protein ACRC8Y_12040, partial [Chroococcales cyanobacterium]
YDPHTIAAAALQMAYDRTRPNWANNITEDAPEEDHYSDKRYDSRDRSSRSFSKPIKRSKPRNSSSREPIGERQ